MLKIIDFFMAFLSVMSLTIYATNALAQAKITIAFQSPIEHHLAQNILFFKEELEKTSRKSVLVKINDYGSYLKESGATEKQISKEKYFLAKDILEAVKGRKVEAGMLSLSRLSNLIPLADLFNQPFLVDSEKKVADTVSKDSIVRRSIESALLKLGITALWWQPYGSVIFVSNGSPIQNPEQMQNKKVRVFSETLGNLVLASGGTPLAIPNSLQYFAYEHQKVDMGMTTIADIRNRKIWDVMDTISLTNSANMQFLIIVNSSWWNSLNPNLRRLISQSAATAEKKSVETLKIIEAISYKEAIQNGMKLVVLSEDDRDYWREISSPVYKKFLESTGSEGQIIFDRLINY